MRKSDKDAILLSLHTVASDLKKLMQETQEENMSLLVSEASAKHFPAPAKTIPPRPVTNHHQAKPLPPALPKASLPPSPKKREIPVLSNPPSATAASPSPVTESPSTFFVLEPLPTHSLPPAFGSKGELAQKIQKLFPQWKFMEHPPSDEDAIHKASAWKVRKATTEILVFLFSSKPQVRAFMYNFANALGRTIAPTQLIDAREIEKEHLWETALHAPALKAIYAPPLESWNTPKLLTYVKTILSTGESFLGDCPLYFLKEIDVYLNSFEEKRLLWEQVSKKV